MSSKYINITGSKLLIVDDNQENIELLSRILEAEGYDIAFAMDGKKAIEIATIYQPDLILMDVMMPGIDGFETCRRLKSLRDLRSVPIIFVTAKSNITDVVQAFNIGAVDYVTKPLHHEEIIARVETHLQLQALISLRDELITQLREQNIELEKMAKLKDDKLEKSEKFSHLGELVGELTHEIGSPIGIVNTGVTSLIDQRNSIDEKMKDNKLSKPDLVDFMDTSKDILNISASNLQHVANIIGSFKKIVVGEFSQSKSQFEVDVYLKDIEHILTPKLKHSPHQLIIECNEKITMDSESGALSQILLNLINNALIHAFIEKERGQITVRASSFGNHVVFVISDNGGGISTENQLKIFDKYYTTREYKGGSGLGLYIVKKLVTDNLNGEIDLKSNLHEGTAYTITLPRVLH